MMTLFNLSQEQQMLNCMLEESGGELTPDIEQALEINQSNFIVKAENYGKALLHYKAMEAVIAAEQDRLLQMKRTIQNTQQRLKDSISDAMHLFGKDSMEFDTLKLSFRKSTQVMIDENANIPNEFIKVKTEIDKAGIKEALKTRNIQGCRLQENLNLQVK
jgi:uncharacterized protein (DUF2235 family)